MTRTELINEIAKSVKLTKTDTAKVVKTYEQIVAKTLNKGSAVSLIGFGKFSVVNKAARNGHNPATGKMMKIPASRRVRFKVGKRLTDSVRN